jgi:CAAX protease family protein
MRNSLKYQHPGVQFAIFMGLAAAMFLTYKFIADGFFTDVIRALTASDQPVSREALTQFRWAQLISTVLTFIIPALVFAYICDDKPLYYLGLKRRAKLLILLLIVFLLVAAQPFAIFMGQLNQQVNFGKIQVELQRMEHLYENAMNNFVRMDTTKDLLINLLIVAILPAVGEELFFRGALQNILERWTGVPWIAIFLSSFGFAILHGTFFKFLGIFTLGLVLGTLFFITRNLWYNIFFHFLNNSMALIATFYASKNPMLKRLSQDDYKISLLAALTSLVVTIGIFLLIRRRSPHQPMTSMPMASSHFDIE